MSCQQSASPSSYQTGGRSHLIPATTGQVKKRQCYHGIRKIKSKGAILVLISSCLVYGTAYSVYAMSKSEYEGRVLQDGPGVAGIIVLALFSPLAGWLADVHYGRYKVMRTGLWLMWVGTLYCGVILIFYHHYEHTSTGKNLLNYAGLVPAAILFTAGLAAFAVNTLQFGADQMPDASAEEVSAFIHWFVWVKFAGESIGILTSLIYDCTYYTISKKYGSVVETVIPATMISLALCCDFLFRGWLTIEPESQNPLKIVSGVLKYAATHKCAERPSAFTYCEDERPLRIDFAKGKYGGPFTTEQVEDVKTCGRMLVVIVLTAALIVPIDVYLISRNSFQPHLKQIQGLNTCVESVVQSSYSEAIFAAISIPIYEVLIYPLVRNRIPSMLKRLGIGAILIIIFNLILLSIDTIGHTAEPSASCMFNTSGIPLDIDYTWVGASSNFLVAVQMLIFLVAILEFTLAQAPYNMKGLLVGIVLSLIFSTFPIGYGIFVAWDTNYKLTKHWKPSCGFWFFLSQALYATLGLGVLYIVAKRYKRRQRDEIPYDRSVLEAVYCK